MLNILPGRVAPQNRVHSQSGGQQPTQQTKTYTAPIGGLIASSPLAAQSMQTAVLMENFWPTTTGIEPRGGTELRCSIPGEVKQLFEYKAATGTKFFAADTDSIYEFSPQTTGGDELAPSWTGQTNADYSILETQTDGGSFLTLVNGADHALIYDGKNWQQVDDASTPFTITGVDTRNLSFVWSHRNRNFFIEKGTMKAWYTGVNSIAGELTKLPLTGVFNKGGYLLFGATWSSDSGSGMDDRCVFATNRGEFAVYSGDPATSEWRLNGVYDIGEPFGQKATMTIGGDLIVATNAGLIPISAAVQKDSSQLKLLALTQPVASIWEQEIALSGNLSGWRLVKWVRGNAAFVCPPRAAAANDYCYAVNLETGAWTKFTGWNISSMAELGGDLYYGAIDGNIYLCDRGGTDNGELFECRCCFAFDDLASPGALKTVHSIRGMWKYFTPINPKHTTAVNFQPKFSNPPDVSPNKSDGEGVWGVSEWDEDYWASTNATPKFQQKWETVSSHGKAIAPQVQITSGTTNKLNCELVSIDLAYSTGGVMV